MSVRVLTITDVCTCNENDGLRRVLVSLQTFTRVGFSCDLSPTTFIKVYETVESEKNVVGSWKDHSLRIYFFLGKVTKQIVLKV